MTLFLDTRENFHPYECGFKNCCHCDRRDDETHDPGVCALCDPEYDMMPNPFWNRRRRRREKAWTADREEA